MNNPPTETDEVQGAKVFGTGTETGNPTPTATSTTPGVRVYDRPEGSQGMNMTTIILMVVALIVVGAIVWSVMM